MAWTTPRTWVTSELVTAAFMNTHVRDNLNYLLSTTGASNSDNRTFTSTGFLDLDALTGGAGTIAAVALTLTTTTRAIVTVGASEMDNSGGVTLMSYRVSGATTIAASDTTATRAGATTQGAACYSHMVTLTAGSNTFELQARATAGTGRITAPFLVVHAI